VNSGGQDAPAGGVPAAPGREELAEKIAQFQRRQGRYDALLAELQASGEEKIAVGDSTSRNMKGAHGEHFIQRSIAGWCIALMTSFSGCSPE